MKTKQECLDLLAKLENVINNNKWQYDSTDGEFDLLSHEDMVDYAVSFELPIAKWKSEDEFELPEGWLEDSEVSERYIEVYENLRYHVSIEHAFLSHQMAMDEREAHADFFRI